MSFWDFLPVIGPAINSAASIFGQQSANRANRDIARDTNIANAQQAKAQMDWQERMSNTSWQRGMADMKAAGINPIFAMSQGGASTPMGASIPNVTGAPQQNVASGISDIATSALNAKMSLAQLDQVKESTRKTMSDIDLNNALKASAIADAELKENNALVAKRNAENLKLQQPGLVAESVIDRHQFGMFGRMLNRLNPFVHSSSALTHAIKAKNHILSY